VPRPTRGHGSRFPLRGCHPLWPAIPDGSSTRDPCRWPGPRSLATTSGVSRRWLSPTPLLMSFPPATEMFQFAGFASQTYGFSLGYPGRVRGGLPHSEIPGSPIARISPGLFAACYVLPRLSVPRHPPDALLLLRSATPNGKDHNERITIRADLALANSLLANSLLELRPVGLPHGRDPWGRPGPITTDAANSSLQKTLLFSSCGISPTAPSPCLATDALRQASGNGGRGDLPRAVTQLASSQCHINMPSAVADPPQRGTVAATAAGNWCSCCRCRCRVPHSAPGCSAPGPGPRAPGPGPRGCCCWWR
jgi:hypothetical protein